MLPLLSRSHVRVLSEVTCRSMAGLKANLQGAGAAQQDGPSVFPFLNLTPSLQKIRHVSLQLATKERRKRTNEHPRSLCVPAVCANTRRGERRAEVKPANRLSLSKHRGNCQAGNIHSQISKRGWQGGELFRNNDPNPAGKMC